MQTLKKFIKYYKPYKAVFFIDLLCATIISAIDLAFPQLLRTLTKEKAGFWYEMAIQRQQQIL